MKTSAFQNILKGNIKAFIPKETEKRIFLVTSRNTLLPSCKTTFRPPPVEINV